MNNSIKPGKVWLDTNGNRIQAHGASVFYENDTFYWYGENKEKTSVKNKIWSWGIRCYSSKDLYNWKDEGLLIEPESDNKKSVLYPSRRLDRPHIIYNPNTKKYVCWLKFCDKNHFSIMTADRFLGPYQMKNEVLKPFGRESGDFDLIVDQETGKGCLWFESDHKEIMSVDLTEDYLDVVSEYKVHFENLRPPFCREGVAHFMRNGKHYMVTSGMTGYIPNPSEVAVSDKLHGPFTVQGNPHVNDDSSASFNSQISSVFRHPHKKDLYIAIADRWRPTKLMTKEKYEWLERSIASNYDKKYKASILDKMKLAKIMMIDKDDTSIADYVWLPIRFDGDKAYIDWKDEWRVEDF